MRTQRAAVNSTGKAMGRGSIPGCRYEAGETPCWPGGFDTMPGWPRWNASIEAERELVERTHAEMQEYFDERSEEWQDGERAEEHQEKTDLVQTLLDAFGDLAF